MIVSWCERSWSRSATERVATPARRDKKAQEQQTAGRSRSAPAR